MPTQYLITYEETAVSEIRKERLRAETRAALGSAPLGKNEHGQAIREVTVTVEDLEELLEVFRAVYGVLILRKEPPSSAAACHRALEETKRVLSTIH
jgi:hypothetical protein